MYNANVVFKTLMDEVKGLAMLELMGARAVPGHDYWVVTGMDDETRTVLWDLCSYYKAW